MSFVCPEEWGLTPMEARIFVAILERGWATRAQVLAVVYGARPRSASTVSVLLGRVNAKLAPFGVAIERCNPLKYGPSGGWRVEARARERLLAAEGPAP